MTKKERLDLIRHLISENDVETQNDLVKLLRENGIKATQATVSRDINEIGITKVPDSDHRYKYSLPQVDQEPEFSSNGLKIIKQVAAPHPLNPCLLYVETVPGNARLLKRKLLDDYKESCYSIVADDDGVLIVGTSEQAVIELRSLLLDWSD